MGHHYYYYSYWCKPTGNTLGPNFQEDSDILLLPYRDAFHVTLVSEREGAFLSIHTPSFIPTIFTRCLLCAQ